MFRARCAIDEQAVHAHRSRACLLQSGQSLVTSHTPQQGCLCLIKTRVVYAQLEALQAKQVLMKLIAHRGRFCEQDYKCSVHCVLTLGNSSRLQDSMVVVKARGIPYLTKPAATSQQQSCLGTELGNSPHKAAAGGNIPLRGVE